MPPFPSPSPSSSPLPSKFAHVSVRKLKISLTEALIVSFFIHIVFLKRDLKDWNISEEVALDRSAA